MGVRRRIFTRDEARALLPEVAALTRAAYEEVEACRTAIEALPPDDEAAREEYARRADAAVRRWAEAIAALGAEPKGVFLVDFDSGDGFYYCWQFGEDDIRFVHDYDAGFAGRRALPSDG